MLGSILADFLDFHRLHAHEEVQTNHNPQDHCRQARRVNQAAEGDLSTHTPTHKSERGEPAILPVIPLDPHELVAHPVVQHAGPAEELLGARLPGGGSCARSALRQSRMHPREL